MNIVTDPIGQGCDPLFTLKVTSAVVDYAGPKGVIVSGNFAGECEIGDTLHIAELPHVSMQVSERPWLRRQNSSQSTLTLRLSLVNPLSPALLVGKTLVRDEV